MLIILKNLRNKTEDKIIKNYKFIQMIKNFLLCTNLLFLKKNQKFLLLNFLFSFLIKFIFNSLFTRIYLRIINLLKNHLLLYFYKF